MGTGILPSPATSFSWVEPSAWIFSCPAPGQTKSAVIAKAPQQHRRPLPKEGIHHTSAWSSTTPDSGLVLDSHLTTYGENLLCLLACLLAGSQARSNIINAYLHPLPSSLGAQGGPALEQPEVTHACRHLHQAETSQAPLSILSFSPCSSARTGHVSGGVSTHWRCFVIPASPFPPPLNSKPPPNLYPNLRIRSLSGFFNISALSLGGLACSAHHYPLILIDRGEIELPIPRLDFDPGGPGKEKRRRRLNDVIVLREADRLGTEAAVRAEFLR
jgi:hypothetical protein